MWIFTIHGIVNLTGWQLRSKTLSCFWVWGMHLAFGPQESLPSDPTQLADNPNWLFWEHDKWMRHPNFCANIVEVQQLAPPFWSKKAAEKAEAKTSKMATKHVLDILAVYEVQGVTQGVGTGWVWQRRQQIWGQELCMWSSYMVWWDSPGAICNKTFWPDTWHLKDFEQIYCRERLHKMNYFHQISMSTATALQKITVNLLCFVEKSSRSMYAEEVALTLQALARYNLGNPTVWNSAAWAHHIWITAVGGNVSKCLNPPKMG